MLHSLTRSAPHPSQFLRLKIPARELPALPVGSSVHSSRAVTDRKSTFVGHAVKCRDLDEALVAFSHIQQIKKVSKASHHILAFRFSVSSPSPGGSSGHDDGGEATAGRKLLRLLELQGAQDVLVVVNRWYGGVQLGNDRFKLINSVAKEALEAGGWTASGEK